jgi:hypothetical protein
MGVDGRGWPWMAWIVTVVVVNALNLNCTSHFTIISILKEANFMAQFTQALS